MGDFIEPPGRPKLPSKDDYEFVVDLARFAEGIVDEAAVRKKYRLADDVWAKLGEDDDLVRAITDEKVRRIRNGSSKREKAQLLIVRAPAILDSIMSDASASPRHRVDAIKTLDSFTTNPQEGAATAGLFQITINLGVDHVEHYSKSIAVDPGDGAPNGSSTPQRSLPAANKSWDSDAVEDAPARTGYKLPDYEPDRPTVAQVKTPVKTDENGKAKAAAVKAVKKAEQQTGRLVERRTPEEIALESLMTMD